MTDIPARRLPPWAARLEQPRQNQTGSDVFQYVGTAGGQKVDPSVPEREIGPVPSITDTEKTDRHGMRALGKGRGVMSGEP